jgi:hypothetical protein
MFRISTPNFNWCILELFSKNILINLLLAFYTFIWFKLISFKYKIIVITLSKFLFSTNFFSNIRKKPF